MSMLDGLRTTWVGSKAYFVDSIAITTTNTPTTTLATVLIPAVTTAGSTGRSGSSSNGWRVYLSGGHVVVIGRC